MTNHYDRYVVESAERLDVRWYRIRMHGGTWLVDYSNPADLRRFLPGLFPEASYRCRVWDEKDLPESITARKGRPVRRVSWWGKILYLVFVLDYFLMPAPVNVAYLTTFPWVSEHWVMLLAVVLLGELAVMLAFSRCWTSKLDPGDAPCRLMVQVEDPMGARGRPRVFIIARWMLAYVLFIGAGTLIMVAQSSWAGLVGFVIAPSMMLMFERFYLFAPLTDRRKYVIVNE